MLAEALAAVSFAIVAYQDLKERMVSDWAWLPAVASVPVALWQAGSLWWVVAAKIGVLALAAMAGLAIQAFGEADAIGLTLMGVGVGIISPLPQLVAMAVASLVFVAYLALKYGTFRVEKVLPVEEAAAQNKWIPLEIMLNGNTYEARGAEHSRSRAYGVTITVFGLIIGLVDGYSLARAVGLTYIDPAKGAAVAALAGVAGMALGYFTQRAGSKYEDAWESLNQYKGTGATVRLAYGVPLVTYMAIGYLAYFVYLLLGAVQLL